MRHWRLERLKKNPYALVCFGGITKSIWRTVEACARKLKLPLDNPNRLVGAATVQEEVGVRGSQRPNPYRRDVQIVMLEGENFQHISVGQMFDSFLAEKQLFHQSCLYNHSLMHRFFEYFFFLACHYQMHDRINAEVDAWKIFR